MILFGVMLTAFSCSNLTKNIIKQDSRYLRGGVFEKMKWDDSLKFERTSWFHELTLVFDSMLAPIDDQSPFYKWLSKSEKDSLDRCQRSYISVSYAYDSKKISQLMYRDILKKQGLKEVAIPQFKGAFALHQDNEKLSLQLYKIKAFCYDGPKKKLTISFPSFNSVDIAL